MERIAEASNVGKSNDLEATGGGGCSASVRPLA
jgi:hypothetical protein